MFGFIKKIFKGKDSAEKKPIEESSQPIEIKEDISKVESQPIEIKEDISKVESQPIEIKEDISKVESQPIEIKEDISKVDSQPVEIKEEISKVESQPIEIKEDISKVDSQPIEIKEDSQPIEIKEEISKVDSQPVEIKEEISKVDSQPAEIKEEISKVESQPVEIKEEISKVESQPVEIKEEISKVDSQPVEIKEEISKVDSQPVEIKEEVSKIESQPIEIKEEISKVDSQPVEIKEEVSKVESQPIEIKEEVSKVDSQPIEFKEEISNIEEKINSSDAIILEQEIQSVHQQNKINEIESNFIKNIKENQVDPDLTYEEKQDKLDEIQHHIVEEVENLINQQLHTTDHDLTDQPSFKTSETVKSESDFQTKKITDQFESLVEEQLEEIKRLEAERTIETPLGKIILPLPFAELEIQAVLLPRQGYVVEFTAEELEEELNKYVFGEVQDQLGDASVSYSSETAEKPKLEDVEKLGWFARLRQGLQRTRDLLSKRLSALFSLNRKIDDDLYEELETILLTSDVGIEACSFLMTELQKRVNAEKLETGDQLKVVLKDLLYELLLPLESELTIDDFEEHKPYIIMMVGVNGAGKTTTIGKLAKYFQSHGKSVLLAAGDTFRAAAREQLMVWGERNNVTVVAQDKGDPAAVVFDAIASAKAKQIDIVLADTAGRLATQHHLMKEIEKVKRVIQKAEPNGPHEILLVIDPNTGQNGLLQVKQFDDALNLTGLILTKLDGTAKGGIIAAIAKNRPKPVRFIGVGEGIDDLRPFTAREFVDAMFD